MTSDLDPGAEPVWRPAASGPARVSLAPMLNSSAAAGLTSDLLAVRGRPVQIDAGAVSQLGGLCLQVLLSAGKTWAADKVPYAVTPVSRAFRDQASFFGADLPFDSEGAAS
jgi:chemotaxis protein CheX